jgi:AcrR family transcriptional regulator
MTTVNRQATRSQTARDNITQAALTVFALKGYGSASMDDVCLAAGCSKGGLYHHFRTKSAVLRGVVGRLAQDGSLLPSALASDAAAAAAASVGRVLIDVWAEAARNTELQAQLGAYYQTRLGPIGQAANGLGLSDLLRIGSLIRTLTRTDEVDPAEAAQRLGIKLAA